LKKTRSFIREFWHKLSIIKLTSLFIYTLSTLIFFQISLNRKIALIKTIGLYVRYKPQYSLPLFGLLLFFVLSIKKNEYKRIVLFFLIITLFAFSLAGIWASTKTENYLVSGLLPFSDASFQYAGALKLLDYGELNGTASRRPISAELIALLLAATNRNLQLALSILVFISAVFTWYAVIEVNQLFNKYSAILFLFVSILFYSKFAGTVMTENLGFILGMLSLTFFLRSVKNFPRDNHASIWNYLFGTFIYSLGQNVRPGAVVTIPLLIIFAGILNRKKPKIFNWKMAGMVLLASTLPFAINVLHFVVNGMEETMPMSNMAYGLYGFVSGGKLWSQVFADNPVFLDLTISKQNSYMFSHILTQIFENPQNIIYGYLKEFEFFFNFDKQTGFLSTIKFEHFQLYMIAGYVVIILFAIGFLRIIFNLNSAIGGFLLIIILGYLLSIPFASGYQTIYLRLHAVSLPFLYLLVAYGLEPVMQTVLKEMNKKGENLVDMNNKEFIVFILSIIIFSPLLLMLFNNKIPSSNISCPKGLETSVVFYNPNSTLAIMNDEEQKQPNWVPNTYQYKFRSEIHNICCENEIAFFENLQAPVSIFNSINPEGSSNYVITNPNLLPRKAGWIQLCGRTTDVLGIAGKSGFFFPEEIYILRD
jgi:hypothetical protein